MDLQNNINCEIETLSAMINLSPDDHSLYMKRGRLYHQVGSFSEAYNDFVTAVQMTDNNIEALSYIETLKEIFAFRHIDTYNP